MKPSDHLQAAAAPEAQPALPSIDTNISRIEGFKTRPANKRDGVPAGDIICCIGVNLTDLETPADRSAKLAVVQRSIIDTAGQHGIRMQVLFSRRESPVDPNKGIGDIVVSMAAFDKEPFSRLIGKSEAQGQGFKPPEAQTETPPGAHLT